MKNVFGDCVKETRPNRGVQKALMKMPVMRNTLGVILIDFLVGGRRGLETRSMEQLLEKMKETFLRGSDLR